MKLIFVIICALFLFAGCKKKSKESMISENIDQGSSMLLKQANFSSNLHTTLGKVSVYEKSTTNSLVFEGFNTDAGPDLRVYLSKGLNNKVFVEVGKLNRACRSFSYDFSNSINTSEYKYVLIWCEDYSLLFGYALLQ